MRVEEIKKEKKITDLVATAKADPKIFEELKLGVLSNYKAQEINAHTTLRVDGANRIITTHGIVHALNSHSNPAKESAKKQIVLCEYDFELIPDILNNADKYEKGSQFNRKGQEAVVFIKKIKKHTYYVVMSLVNKSHITNLVFNTMYIKDK